VASSARQGSSSGHVRSTLGDGKHLISILSHLGSPFPTNYQVSYDLAMCRHRHLQKLHLHSSDVSASAGEERLHALRRGPR
jgi:hypothetical protein